MFSLQRVKLCLCYLFQLKMWISFMIPKIEDGNNFGVSIQEDTLGEIQSVESEAAAFFDQISRYFVSRGKIVSKVYIRIHEYHVVKNRGHFEASSFFAFLCSYSYRAFHNSIFILCLSFFDCTLLYCFTLQDISLLHNVLRDYKHL